MMPSTLAATAQMLAGGGKGPLAMDESTGTCNCRFAREHHRPDC